MPILRTVRRVSFYMMASLVFLVAMLLGFTVLYHVVEDLPWLDAFYFTVITTRTIGFGDISPHTTGGKLVTIANALLPATVFLGTSLIVLEACLKGLERWWRVREMSSHRDHTIIVADVALLPSILAEYRTEQTEFVVIHDLPRVELPEPLPELLADAEYLQGDPTLDSTLEQAQIRHATRILIASGDDTRNLFILVSARGLNPKITTIVRVNDESTGPKFKAVGADYLLPTGSILGRLLSQAAANPISHNFIVRLHTHTQDPFLAERKVRAQDVGKRVTEVYPHAVAVYRGGDYVYDVSGASLATGDVVLTISLKFQ